ncbi:hypothetical protein [Halosegnis sp.]|uniref:hypothetical protein n=1 Tax=Halosegnis sp. TaxID=2864959 RepID=UPI0035D4851D
MRERIAEATPFQRFVLLGVLELDGDGETPAYSFDVYDLLEERVDDLAGDRIVGVTRSDVIETLSVLEAEGLLDEERPDDASPTGKGRPTYVPAVDRAEALDVLGGDEMLAPVVATLRE